MNRYFKIIGKKSRSITFLEEDFTMGKIYRESIESDGSKDPALVGNLGEWFWVSGENLKEVSEQDYLHQQSK